MVRGISELAGLLHRITGLVFLLLTSGCAGNFSFPDLSSFSSSNVTMPADWNDDSLDRLEQGKSTKVAIAVFEGQASAGLPKDIDLKWNEMLVTALVQTGRFDVLERAKLDRVIQEQKLALNELVPGGFASQHIVDPKTAPKLGKLFGAQAMVYGTLTSITYDKVDKFAYYLERFQVTLDIHAVDTTTGKIFLSDNAPGLFESKLYTTADGKMLMGTVQHQVAYVNAVADAVQRIVPKISEHFPPLGSVVKVTDDKIYLSVGQSQGAKQGDQFVVFRKGAEILQPRSAAHLGWEKEVIGSVTVATLEKDMSIARPTKLNDRSKPIMPGDFAVKR